ncbi:DNA damage-regulated autophagy modulator protein 1-like isoform X1 [Engystomops pustulosus]|uniref:DNA damage-regulated autophagy modulator protein 1-like isoform X1 n=1 Tax=Engystomops pustulosus TaxID=76066 RepID=UPI003AFA1320
MEFRGLGFVPLFIAFWCTAWVAVSYTLTVIYGHAPLLTYISDTGNYYPENITFKIGFLGMSNANLFLALLQYNFILLHAEAFGAHQPMIQKILLAMGITSCIGTAVLAMFETDFYPVTHRVGAFFAFACGCVYNLWQAILLYEVPGIRRAICHIRMASSAMAFIGVITFIGCRVSVFTKLCIGDYEKIIEIISISTEWLMLLLILIQLVTCFQPMQQLSLTVSWKGYTICKRENQDSAV